MQEFNYVEVIEAILRDEHIDKPRHAIRTILQSRHDDNRNALAILKDVVSGFDVISRIDEVTVQALSKPERPTYALHNNGKVVRILGAGNAGIIIRYPESDSILSVPLESLINTNDCLPVLVIQGSAAPFISSPTAVSYHVGYGKEDDHEHHYSTTELLGRLWHFLLNEKKDLVVVFGYSVVMGLLSLALPLASQSLVNAVSLGVYTTQLTVLCIGVGIGILILGVFQVLELTVVDVMRRRIFLRAAFDVAQSLSRVTMKSLE